MADDNKYDHAHLHIKNMSHGKCEDELAQIHADIIIKVRRMSRDWLALVALNQRKEKIENRLAELGFK